MYYTEERNIRAVKYGTRMKAYTKWVDTICVFTPGDNINVAVIIGGYGGTASSLNITSLLRRVSNCKLAHCSQVPTDIISIKILVELT